MSSDLLSRDEPDIAGADARDRRDPAGRRPWPKKLYMGGGLVALFAVVALLAPLLPFPAPDHQDLLSRLAPPSSGHILGTDELGRDELSRVVYAARIDISISALAVTLPMLIGTTLGALAGYYGGPLDRLVSALATAVQAFPIYVFLIALVFALGPGAPSIIIAYTGLGWVLYARLMRGEVLRIRSLEYVLAARTLGLSTLRVLTNHVGRNAIKQSLIYFFSDVVGAILALASLSYFGLGIAPPAPEWGAMIASGQTYLQIQWWLVIAPGLAVTLFGIGLSLIADGLDEVLRDT